MSPHALSSLWPALTMVYLRTALSGLSKRVANLETERAQLRHATDGLRAELESLGSHLDNFEVSPSLACSFNITVV